MAVWADMDEGRIIEQCRNGDRAAFRVLFEAHKDRVHSIAFHFCGSESGAQDITQEVFVRLFQTLGQFRAEAAFKTWLHRIVVNTCLNQQRRRRRLVPLEPSAAREMPSLAASPEKQVHGTQLALAVRKAVASLKADLRMPLLLRYMEGLSYAEIAQALDCSIGTVSSRLNRAHKILGRKLSPYRRELS